MSRTENLSLKIGAKMLLKPLSVELESNQLHLILGPNGAGKSTFINVLSGLARKTAGNVEIWGHNIDVEMRMARSSIGVVPQELNLDPFFTPFEAVELQAGLYGVPRSERRTDEILKSVRLIDHKHAYARALSGGMRRRLLVAKAMAHSPPVLVLDEPTAGVDVELRRQLWDTIRELNRSGTTVMLTTHYLEEAEELCDQIAIINKGRVVACEPTRKLVQRLDRKDVHLTLRELPAEIPQSLQRFETNLEPPDTIRIRFAPSKTPMPEVLAAV
ncbi:MAG TPA: multidrug ABC transporter ATP-binding protein, partial [Cryomorphaceae bacterium]|nr:multidrug ABC transporter ATP-binding protein [Cryomorphaceae bacterium]